MSKIFSAVLLSCLLNLSSAHAADDFKGSWTIMPSDDAGHVRFGLVHRSRGGSSQSESDWPVTAFQGLDLAEKARHDVQFTVSRDAGLIRCEGYLKEGNGAGLFEFAPDTKYVKAMDALGFDDIDDDKQFAMAIHDVSLEFARAMKAEKLDGLDTDKLLAFRIFNVDSKFIREMRGAGLTATDVDKLIAFRIHGVTPEMVRAVRKAGINASEDQLIAFRIHGVTPEFIESVGKLGFRKAEADQLVAMRIHGVTPEYIAQLKSRGMKDLSIDQLVNLRIHGID